MASGELEVSDVREQAVVMGKDIEAVDKVYGSHVIESVIPKLISLLDKLETLAVKRDDGKSTITALLLEREDLMVQHDENERRKRELERALERTESLVKSSERKLKGDVKFLKDGNKRMSKELKKKKKKIKKIEMGKEQNFISWLLDRALFGGRIYFMTTELPRDANRISHLSDTIIEQKREIDRLRGLIEMQNCHKSCITENITRRASYANASCNSETSELGVARANYMRRSFAHFPRGNVIRRSFAKEYLDDEMSNDGSSTKTISRHSYTNDYLNNDASERESKHLTRLSYANYYPDSVVLEDELVSKKLSPSSRTVNKNLDEKHKFRELKPNDLEVTVDIHCNRKDFKKLVAKGIDIENPEHRSSDTDIEKVTPLHTPPSNYEYDELLFEDYLNNTFGDVKFERFLHGGANEIPGLLLSNYCGENKLLLPRGDNFDGTDSEASTCDTIDESRYWNCPSRSSAVAESESVISSEPPDKHHSFPLDDSNADHQVKLDKYSNNLKRRPSSWPKISLRCATE